MSAQFQLGFEDVVDKPSTPRCSNTTPGKRLNYIYKDRVIFHGKQAKARVLYDQKTEM